jgi:DNA-binding response OmpR family regulator
VGQNRSRAWGGAPDGNHSGSRGIDPQREPRWDAGRIGRPSKAVNGHLGDRKWESEGAEPGHPECGGRNKIGASNSFKRSGKPILGLTRRGDLPTKLKAFDLGVDDILTVPFSPEELLARSIVIARRASGIETPIVPTIKLGEVELDIVKREVRAGSCVVHLSSIEQSLLYLLASRGGRVVSREELLDAAWGTDFVAESNIVDRHIRSLRIKLQDDYREPCFIATVPGKGYRFVPTFSNRGWMATDDQRHDETS